MPPKLLFIDWDKALSNSRFWEQWEPAKYRLAAEALFANSPELVNEWMCGYRTASEVMQYVADVTGLPYDELMRELQRSCERMTFINKQDIELIQPIRNMGIGVVIATDNMDTFSRWTVPALKLDQYFDGVLLSVDRGALKSHIAHNDSSMFFDHFFASTGLQPGEAVLIDDSVNNKVVERLGIGFRHVTAEAPLNWHLREVYELASATRV